MSFTAHSETGEQPFAKIVLTEDGKERHAAANGSGPVDAAFKAGEEVAASGAELVLYSVNNITSGTDAQGEVTVRLEKGGRIVNGQGADGFGGNNTATGNYHINPASTALEFTPL